MANTVEIANLALQEVGAESITDLQEDSKRARVVNVRFNQLRDSFLRMHPWNFAKRRQRLSLLVEKPDFGFENAFALPADWLRTIHVFTTDAHHHDVRIGESDYRIEGNRVFSEFDELFMVYVARIVNTEAWDPLATDAFVLLLASRIAIPITNNFDLAQQLKTDFVTKLSEARGVDAADEPPRRIESDEWLASRFGAGTGFHSGAHGDIDGS